MRVLLQRVSNSKVEVSNKKIGEIQKGLMLLVGFKEGDREEILVPMADKILNLRVFPNSEGKFDKSLLNIKGEILVIPQFTLYGETKKGRRPDFFKALEPKKAKELVDKFIAILKNSNLKVESGEFGANMQVSLINDGPVTLMLEM